MFIILSSSKTLKLSSIHKLENHTKPYFQDQACELVLILKNLSKEDLSKKLDIKGVILDKVFEYFSNFHESCNYETIYTFLGDAYESLSAFDFNHKELEFAQNNLGILSGLYGIIKPYDLISPYRLEMATKIHFDDYKDLYDFWKPKLTSYLLENTNSHESILNLASNEYSKAIDLKRFNVITPCFYDIQNGVKKSISIYSKRARGAMARFAIKNQISDIEKLKTFSEDGYIFDELLSSKNKLVFKRKSVRN